MAGDVQSIKSMHPAGSEFERQLTDLKREIPADQVKSREGWRDRQGNSHFVEYVEWHTVADILDENAPRWSHTVRDVREIGDILTVTVAITIDGVTREGIGTGAAGTEQGIKKAEHDALKRAAVKFGIARELYKKESDLIEQHGVTGSNAAPPGAPSNPIARSHSDLVTAKQLGLIRARAREKNLDPDTECGAIWTGVKTDELTTKAASYLIRHLQDHKSSPVAPPDSSPVTDPINKNVREFPKQEAPKTPTSEAENMRNAIIAAFNEIKVKPEASLAGFDRLTDEAKQRVNFDGVMKFVIQEKRSQIKKALQNQPWSQNESEGELAKFGIEDGIDKASPEQIVSVYADYRKAGLL